ncbi:chitin disaccharide deacetylase [Caproiciproducens sp. MSJ-32]|uniref:chitin disaccharide deacetylase n=1 Tax=Caproiciproducens sp. MSJ-32 TaxID=2841527 RepID=UPI001C0F3E83|nr:chitin disaccharide deacetylase [Caproiciproducens sp. MSJ-32]MBU5455846.1 chitin disaccharide deacetylase [Caproiciproducens sp. MSJ-32]
MKLIVNADDFGFSKAVNYGIIEAHKTGIITSTTIMAGMPAFDHAVELLKENPELGCGVHLTLSAYKPVLKTHKTIVDEEGNFDRKLLTKQDFNKIDLNEVFGEFCAQIEKVRSKGINITHLDSHHHVHTFEFLKPVIEEILKKYKLPIRGGLNYKLDYDMVVPFEGAFYDEAVSVESFERIIDKNYELVEVMSHPAYVDLFLLKNSSYNLKRLEELEVITSQELKEFLKENSIELINYRNI